MSCLLNQQLQNELHIDLDRTRIRDVLSEAYNICKDVLGFDFDINQDDFVSQINPYLDSNRVTIPVQLRLPSKQYPMMVIEANLRKRGVFARLPNRDKQILVNRYLTKL